MAYGFLGEKLTEVDAFPVDQVLGCLGDGADHGQVQQWHEEERDDQVPKVPTKDPSVKRALGPVASSPTNIEQIEKMAFACTLVILTRSC